MSGPTALKPLNSALRVDHRHILGLTWPVLLANLTVPLVGTVDTAIMGRNPDPSFIGAIALGATVFTAIGWLFGFLRMGTTGQVAQALGRREYAAALANSQRSLRLAVAIGAGLLLLSPWLLPLLVSAFDASAATSERALTYLSIRIWALPALLAYLVLQGTLFGLQQMRFALIVSLLLNFSSAGLSIALAIGLDWGLAGIAWGSLWADWLSVGCALLLTQRAFAQRGITDRLWGTTQRATGARSLALRMNLDLLLRSFFVQAPFLIYTAVGARLGDVVLAANAVLMQLFFIVVFALDAFAHTAETLAGASYGAGDAQRFRLVVIRSGLWAAALAALGGLAFLLAAGPLFALISESSAVQQEAARYRYWLAAAPLVSVLAFLLDGVFIGTTQTATMRNSMILAFLGFALTIWWGIPLIGNHGLWLGLLVFMVLRAALLGRHLPSLAARIGGGSAL